MNYLVQSTAVWDTIYLRPDAEPITAPGGAGFYALAGMRVWEQDVGLVTGVGADYLEHFRRWYDENGISTAGMLIKDPCSPRTIVRYRPDGERTEEPVYGPEHYAAIEATPAEIAPFCRGAVGLYVFKNASPDYWNALLPLRPAHGFRLMWELAADAALPELRSRVQAIAEQTDVFSLNRTEAMGLLEVASVDAAVEALRTWRVPLIYLRLGADGVCVMGGGKTAWVPSVPDVAVVDATGGGNSSCGGALIGYCQGKSLEEIGAMGNVSASLCIGQWGAPERFDDALQAEAQRRLQQVLTLCREDTPC